MPLRMRLRPSLFPAYASPYTFSKSKVFGLVSRTTRRYSLSVLAFGSLSLGASPFAQYPLFENGWHGGPPMSTSASPERRRAALSSRLELTAPKSSSITGQRRLSRRVL